MKKTALFFIIIIVLLSISGRHYNYGIDRDNSPVPYENPYPTDDHKSYEFYSTLYQFGKSPYRNTVEINHLNDVYNHHHNTPRETWKKSRLKFSLSDKIQLIPRSVKLKHLTTDGVLIKPIKTLEKFNHCENKTGCNGYLTLFYAEGIPETIIEEVSFTLIIEGKEKNISYTITLEYKYDYSFWDVMMGV